MENDLTCKANTNEALGNGLRFDFGENWAHFLSVLDDKKISDAEASLKEMLGVDNLIGQRFLDIGSGSGLFSLAARRLGAIVHSFDFDEKSVACARELKSRYFRHDNDWCIEQASILDSSYIEGLKQFDVVYSWGVLHHTGAMWLGIENAIRCVKVGGKLFIAIYNDQGWKSHSWWFIKLFYNRLPKILKGPYATIVMMMISLLVLIKYTIKLNPMIAISSFNQSDPDRGMTKKHDKTDWVGGFPFEFASFDVLESYFKARGFVLANSKRTTTLGCNQLVLRNIACKPTGNQSGVDCRS